jgi:hypothetical protein
MQGAWQLSGVLGYCRLAQQRSCGAIASASALPAFKQQDWQHQCAKAANIPCQLVCYAQLFCCATTVHLQHLYRQTAQMV